MSPDSSSTGLDPKIAGLLCYLGWFVTGILFLILEKKSRFVKFHAMQSIFISVVLIVINIVLGFIPVLGWLIGLLLTPASLILWIVLMLLALQGRWFKLPVIGDYAEDQAARF
ncbi:DUF4870 domain-containing protein [Paenibacillus nasutitermitis]|uniref:Membrane protein n=1 Tax=Paenibacillus nasutitermitis TaxID=1652958 RepID=A0A916ZJD2_9BACL|nr:DUF4870 domain-containing protein [Paenibacillus nasutitermitis]GGE00477.1 membrane protein [Paenibacillus nasutitermitis]